MPAAPSHGKRHVVHVLVEGEGKRTTWHTCKQDSVPSLTHRLRLPKSGQVCGLPSWPCRPSVAVRRGSHHQRCCGSELRQREVATDGDGTANVAD